MLALQFATATANLASQNAFLFLFFGEAVLMMELPRRHSTPPGGGRFAPPSTATANLASQNAFLFLATHGPIFIASSSSATLIQCGFQYQGLGRLGVYGPILGRLPLRVFSIGKYAFQKKDSSIAAETALPSLRSL